MFILAAFYFTRIVSVLQRWDFYSQVLLPYANVYLLVSGIIWSTSALILAIGLWTGRGWALPALKLGVALYFLYDWIERLVLSRINTPTVNWQFLLIVHLVFIAWLFWNYSRPTVKQFFGEKHEQ